MFWILISFILLILLIFIQLYKSKEGIESKDIPNPILTLPGLNINTDTNTLTIPNNVQGVQGQHLNLGDVSIKKSLSFVNGEKVVGNIAYKEGDILQMTGAGPDQRISLWDKVDIGSLLHVEGDIQLGSKDNTDNTLKYADKLEIKGNPSSQLLLGDNVDISGNLTVGNQDIQGQTVKNQTVYGQQSVKDQLIEGVSTHKGKINIEPSNTQSVDLSIGDEQTGFKQGKPGKKSVSFTSNNQDMGGFDTKGLFVNDNTLLEMGKGIAGKQVDAGTLRYQVDKVKGDALNIVGAGSKENGRKVLLYDDVTVNQNLQVNDSIQVGNWKIFEDQAGDLRFSKQEVNKTPLVDSNREDGIAIGNQGNIWVSQKEVKGFVKNPKMGTTVGDWSLNQGENGELLFSTSKNKKENIAMLTNGTIAKVNIDGTFENSMKGLTKSPYKEWRGDWQKYTDGNSNSIKYVSNSTHYWKVLTNGYQYMGQL